MCKISPSLIKPSAMVYDFTGRYSAPRLDDRSTIAKTARNREGGCSLSFSAATRNFVLDTTGPTVATAVTRRDQQRRGIDVFISTKRKMQLLSMHRSLHAPLLLLPSRRLVLKFLPLPRRLIILPMDHMRVNLLRRSNRTVPQPRGHRRQWDAAGQQVRAVRVTQGVEAGALRQFQSPDSSEAASSEPIPVWELCVKVG